MMFISSVLVSCLPYIHIVHIGVSYVLAVLEFHPYWNSAVLVLADTLTAVKNKPLIFLWMYQ